MDFEALKQIHEEANTGGGLILKQGDLDKDGTDIRILPDTPNMSGLFFVRRVNWWIPVGTSKLPFVSPETFGEVCPIQEEIDAAIKFAKDNEDKDLIAIINKLNQPYDAKNEEFWIPILQLDVKFNSDWSVQSLKVVGEKPKILSCTTMMRNELNGLFTSRNNYNGTKFGLADREKGWNVTLYKNIVKNKTEYKAEAWKESTEFPEKYYTDEIRQDLIAMTKERCYTDDYLRGIIRHYLYNEPKPADEDKVSRYADETSNDSEKSSAPRGGGGRGASATEEKKAPARGGSATKKTAPARGGQAQPDPADTTTTRTRTEAKDEAEEQPANTGRRNIMQDLGDLG